jgi:serine/threonine protein kinase
VGDFGIAVMHESAGLLTRSLRGLGTVGYVSPEQQYGLKADERSDQYSLAALSYELLTGRRPLGLFPPPSIANPRLQREVDSIILRGLREEPEGRYGSVQEFMRALDQALAGSVQTGRRATVALTGFLVLATAVGCSAMLLGLWPQNRTSVVEKLGQAGTPPISPVKQETTGSPQPNPQPRSQEFIQLVKLRAYNIWEQGGRPSGPAGEAVKEKNWTEAERQIVDEVSARAYRIWERQGRPVGAAGEAVREKNLRAAEVELLKEIEKGQHHSKE